MPADLPVTIPVVISTVAIPVALLLHVPPAIASVNCVVSPGHTVNVPVITPGNGLTVTTAVVIQVVGNVYVIVVVPNGPVPVTIPVVNPTDPIPGELLVHVPPPPSVNAVVDPEHTANTPVILAGSGFTVTTVVIKQPVADKV